MTPERIIEIRDEHLPSQGEAFDCLAFGAAIAREERRATLTEAAEACTDERVAAHETGEPSDMAYNFTCDHCALAITKLRDREPR